MAVWAARQLLVTDEWMRLKAQYLSGETDPAVIAEWQG
jgi:hypothetical protein